MEHVSTLCAISTVGIAATGFALGRVDRDSPKPARFRKKASPRHDQCTRATDPPLSPLTGDVHTGPPTPFATAERKATSNFKPVNVSGDDSTSAFNSQRPNHRRKSSLAGIILRRRGQTLSSPPFRVEEDCSTALHIRRPSSSWVRRLSFQPGNRASCQSPISPTSNGPTSPVHSRPSSQRRAPNKLVKRPPSQPSSAHSQFAHAPPSPSATPLLRRPTTSYQRSEYLRHKATHSLNFEPSLLANTPVLPTNVETSTDNIAWQPYITNTHDGLSDKLARRLSTATRPKEHGLRRILPSVDTIPALLLAKSITNKEPLTVFSPHETTPMSPVQFRDPFQPNTIPQKLGASLAPEENGRQPSVSAGDDPKSPMPIPGNTDAQKPSNTTLSRPRRATSTPLPTLAKSEGAIIVSPRSYGRRNITDPNIFRRPPSSSYTEAFTMSGITSPRRKIAPSYSRTDIGHLREAGQRPLTSDGVALSVLQDPIRQRPKRHSIAASDPASTVVGSDDTRIFTSGEEDETDFLSDTAFDSVRTHITASSSSGLRAPRVDTIFDRDLPVSTMDKGSLPLKHLTPHRTVAPQPFGDNHCRPNLVLTPMSVSVPALLKKDVHEGESRISFPSDLTDDEDARSLVAALPEELIARDGQSKYPTMSFNSDERAYVGRDVFFTHDRPGIPFGLTKSDSRSLTNESFDFCPKMNIFDWSEQPRNDRDVSGADGRPRTVHGKHGPELRGSRAPGRKAPNTLHLRSQSVPVSRDSTAPNETRQTSGKFGTWGLGSKGVSEDWDSDFEFDDADESTVSETMKTSKNVPRRGMIVPQAIMERQASLHGQFGQVQELTLLVEELKRLRHQASFLGIVRGPTNELWKEAEGIVDLATLDDEENSHSPPGSPSSLTFSFDDSEEESANTIDPSKRASGESWRASLSQQLIPDQTTTDPGHRELATKASSVLDLIYQQRLSHDSSFPNSHLPRSKKLPFDTQSLRDLVVRAGVVTRALKEVIRKAEGVAPESGENMHHSVPPFSRIFNQPSNDNVSTFEARCIA
ncbi:uncharacterized protein BDW43DRAFT_291216 [Aspergillus alliaceus]|uniref:uncharacterized protein n=1 Tax=Petromyces alliaceus TaxID=209559 RepID=UPI0012A530E7|nr:uncharacterized protein BDW43DRAFT_291216 [Aspergillus alliaceus]KAB8228508.1 hypothetical protein BDW43DRAFT_291216 [Aspergillus alliaceus]